MYQSFERRPVKSRVPRFLLLLTVGIFVWPVEASARVVQTVSQRKTDIKPKAPFTLKGRTAHPPGTGRTTASLISIFDFHPGVPAGPGTISGEMITATAMKATVAQPAVPGVDNSMPPDGDFIDSGDIAPLPALAPGVTPAAITHTGAEPPMVHGTSGTVTHSLTFAPIDPKKPKIGWRLSDGLSGTINPGRSEPKTVTTKGRVKDPITFSDTDDFGLFEFVPGLDISLSLDTVAFPDFYAPDLFTEGAIAEATSMTYRARVAPGVIADADVFWDNSLSGAIDLYTLVLSPEVDIDGSVRVNAVLSFGASDDNFTLDFLDHLSDIFDPTQPTEVDLITNFIESGFTNEALLVALDDIFTVGFVADPGITEYTFGIESAQELTAVELPEPSSLALLALGGLMLGRRRRQPS